MKQSKFVLAMLFAKVKAHHEYQHDDIKRFVGCFVDDSQRDLETTLSRDTSPAECVRMGREGGWKYVSFQWGKQCFASQSYPDYEERPEGECSKRCAYDSSVTCGGGWRNSVYELFPVDPAETCKDKGAGCRGYRGKQSITNRGKTCQRWTDQFPHKHANTPEKRPDMGLGDHNYCRNPDGEDSIWCYTTHDKSRWEHCTPLGNHPERLHTHDGHWYRGKQNQTRSGKTCQKWDSQSPHKHTRTHQQYPEFGLDGGHNYCRNPDGEVSIWCYTTDPGSRWELCDPLGNPNDRVSATACGHDEATNVRGPDKCRSDWDCDGYRTCSGRGWCQGTSGCDHLTPWELAGCTQDMWDSKKEQCRKPLKCGRGLRKNDELHECEPIPPPVGGCKTWFDGCNTCQVDRFGGLAGCTKKACSHAEGAVLPADCTAYHDNYPPLDCRVWFDGCNEVTLSEQGWITAQTERFCAAHEAPYCSAFQPGAARPENCRIWNDGCNTHEWTRDGVMLDNEHIAGCLPAPGFLPVPSCEEYFQEPKPAFQHCRTNRDCEYGDICPWYNAATTFDYNQWMSGVTESSIRMSASTWSMIAGGSRTCVEKQECGLPYAQTRGVVAEGLLAGVAETDELSVLWNNLIVDCAPRPPPGCKAWSPDGCNRCPVARDGEVGGCTRKACVVQHGLPPQPDCEEFWPQDLDFQWNDGTCGAHGPDGWEGRVSHPDAKEGVDYKVLLNVTLAECQEACVQERTCTHLEHAMWAVEDRPDLKGFCFTYNGYSATIAPTPAPNGFHCWEKR